MSTFFHSLSFILSLSQAAVNVKVRSSFSIIKSCFFSKHEEHSVGWLKLFDLVHIRMVVKTHNIMTAASLVCFQQGTFIACHTHLFLFPHFLSLSQLSLSNKWKYAKKISEKRLFHFIPVSFYFIL